MQDYLELYSQTDLAKKVSVDRHKIAKDTVKYIPIRIRTYQTRNNKWWYWVRYLDREEVDEYLKTHTNSWKKKK